MALTLAPVFAPPATAAAATRYVVKKDQIARVVNGPDVPASGFVLGNLYGGGKKGRGPNAHGPEHFDVIDIRRKGSGKRRTIYFYGLAHGHFGKWGGARCGWIKRSKDERTIKSTHKRVKADCPPVRDDSPLDDHLNPFELFYPPGCALDPNEPRYGKGVVSAGGCSWIHGTRHGTVQPAVVVPCRNSRVYGNYDPTKPPRERFANRYPTPLTPGRGSQAFGPQDPAVTAPVPGFGTRYLTEDRDAWLIKDTGKDQPKKIGKFRGKSSPAGVVTDPKTGKRKRLYKVPKWHFIRDECVRRLDGPLPPAPPPQNVIRGTRGDDHIVAGGGNDVVYGGDGNDTIIGGDGNDVLRGGGGNDQLSGGNGDDELRGGNGDDRLTGDPGVDLLRGEEGRDFLDARDMGRANDLVNGGPGDDDCRTDRRDVRRSC